MTSDILSAIYRSIPVSDGKCECFRCHTSSGYFFSDNGLWYKCYTCDLMGSVEQICQDYLPDVWRELCCGSDSVSCVSYDKSILRAKLNANFSEICSKEYDSIVAFEKVSEDMVGMLQSFGYPVWYVNRCRKGRGLYDGLVILPFLLENGDWYYFLTKNIVSGVIGYPYHGKVVAAGVDTINPDKPVMIVNDFESTLFILNSISLEGTGMVFTSFLRSKGIDVVYVLNNDKRDRHLRRDYLRQGCKVFKWAEFIRDMGYKRKNRTIKDCFTEKPINEKLLPFFVTSSVNDLLKV